VDLVEWERFGYRRDLSRAEIEQMSLREYLLRRQAHTREWMQTVRLETLPVLNAWTEDTVTMTDFFGYSASEMDADDRQALKALRYDVEQQSERDIDWTLVDQQLNPEADA